MSESSSNTDDLHTLAILNLTKMRAEGRTPAPIPVTQPPAIPLTPRTVPESAPLALLHPPITPEDRTEAAQTLRKVRVDFLDYICENPQFLRPDGNLKDKWNWRVAAMDADEDGVLLEEPGLKPRANTKYNSIELMQQDRKANKSPWGESSLRQQVQRSADPRAHAATQGGRRVGGQYSKGGLEGDEEEEAVRDARGDVNAGLEGVL
jgi:hypothetical protein